MSETRQSAMGNGQSVKRCSFTKWQGIDPTCFTIRDEDGNPMAESYSEAATTRIVDALNASANCPCCCSCQRCSAPLPTADCPLPSASGETA